MQRRLRGWTLAELDLLPADGNRYELVAGELLVTPPPTPEHEAVGVVLFRIIDRYVENEGLGRVWLPHSVVRLRGQQTEPDLSVRPPVPFPLPGWEDFPLPILIVEILSSSSIRHDKVKKRTFYMDIEVPEYWIVDHKERHFQVISPGEPDRTVSDTLVWRPAGAVADLVIDVQAFFREALGP